MPWPRRAKLSEVQLKRENDGLKTAVCCLRRKLENKEGYAARLELLLHERLTKIDALNGQLEQSRLKIQRMDLEIELLAGMVRLPAVASGDPV